VHRLSILEHFRRYRFGEMKKALWLLLSGFAASPSVARNAGGPSEAAGVDAGDAIRNGVAHLSVEDTALLKRETKNVIEECVKDPVHRIQERRQAYSLGSVFGESPWACLQSGLVVQDLDRACVEPLATVHLDH